MKTVSRLLDTLFGSTSIQLRIIVIVTCIAYINIFNNTLVWDDHDLIVNWPEIRSFSNIPSLFIEATNPNYPDTYRPIRYIFSIFMYQFSGTNPIGYHIAAMILHIAITLLIYTIIRSLARDTRIPFISALLFGVHPIHTEAITWISSGMDMIGIVFFLSSVALFLHRADTHTLWFSLVCAGLAYFTLEITIVLPAILILILSVKNLKNTHRRSFLHVFPYALLAIIYLYIRWRVIDIQEVFGYIDGRVDRTFFLMMHALVVYAKTLLFPVDLTVNHMLHTGVPSFMVEIGDAFPTTLSHIRSITLFDRHVIIGILLVLASLTSVFIFWRKAPLLSFAIGWMIISFLPVMNIVPGHTLMAERYAYLPSVGFCLLLAYIFIYTHKRSKHPLIQCSVYIVLLGVVVSYTTRTIQRNTEWKNDVTLWESAADKNQYSYIVSTALGKQYVARNEYDKAIMAYTHVLQFFPEQKMVIGYLTELYVQARRYTEAITLIQSVIQLRPQEPEIWIKLGDVYRRIPDDENAKHAYQKAKELDPSHPMLKGRVSK